MLKILLVRPNSRIIRTYPPLGLMYLASFLRSRGKQYEISILDARINKLSIEKTRRKIIDYKPHIVGIGALTVEAVPMHSVAQAAKQVDQKTMVIVGGPHPTGAPDDVLKDENIDFVVLGEGEETLLELVKKIEAQEDVEDVDGIAYRRDGEIVVNPIMKYISDLDALPFPAWDLIDVRKYFNKQGHPVVQLYRRYMPVVTSRGCPYKCAYCHHVFGKTYRTRSPGNVLEEIRTLVGRYGIKEIHVEDDSFNIDMERAKAICEKIIESDLRIFINFPNGIRYDFIDEELLDKMKSAGVWRISYAVETVSQRIQKQIRKVVDLEKASRVITRTADKGISTNGYFMIGFMDETAGEMLQTIEYAVESDLHTASFFIVTPFPGTDLYKAAVERGMTSNVDYRNFHLRDVSINLSSVSDRELLKMKRRAFRKFYYRPKRMWRIFQSTPKKLEVLRNFVRIQVLFFGK